VKRFMVKADEHKKTLTVLEFLHKLGVESPI
jgi:hypothetical protein